VPFIASCYGTRTCARVEYHFVVLPEKALALLGREAAGWPLDDDLTELMDDPDEQTPPATPSAAPTSAPASPGGAPALTPTPRSALPLSAFAHILARKNASLAVLGHKPLDELEFYTARLFTGPMGDKYNAVLRALQPGAPAEARHLAESLTLGNQYASTILVLSSGARPSPFGHHIRRSHACHAPPPATRRVQMRDACKCATCAEETRARTRAVTSLTT
jgi:hypothetical protein